MRGLYDLPRLFRFSAEDHLVLSILSDPRPVMMKTILAIGLIGLILSSHPAIGAGGLEVEVGDVQGNENEPLMGTSDFPFLKYGSPTSDAKQDEIENSRLKAVDEKIQKALEEGNRTPAESSVTESDHQTSSIGLSRTKP